MRVKGVSPRDLAILDRDFAESGWKAACGPWIYRLCQGDLAHSRMWMAKAKQMRLGIQYFMKTYAASRPQAELGTEERRFLEDPTTTLLDIQRALVNAMPSPFR